MQELNYTLKGLNCADCAAKIQEEIGEMDGVSSVDLVFATQELNVRVDNTKELDLIEEKIRETINSIEPGVNVIKTDRDKHADDSDDHAAVLKKHLLSLIPSALLFAAVLAFNLPEWIELSLSGLSYLIAGRDIILKAFKNILKGNVFNENFLMTIATIGAFAIKEYPEAAAVMLFFKTGEMLEHMAVNKSRKSIKALLDIRPDYANLLTPDGPVQVNPGLVNAGDTIIVKPGEKVPLDGVIMAGSSYLDTSALTGESIPRPVNAGDPVLSGSVNGSGMLTVQVSKTFSQSTVSRILHLVQNSAAKKAPTESFITKFARYYTPAVVAASILAAVLPPIVTGSYNFGTWFYTALIFLVISCPCALVVSIPLSFFGGIGGASRRGILVKGGNYLESLNNVDTVVFDKTGTLTKGMFKVTGITAVNGFTQEELLELAAMAELHSSHPIAKSILEAYGREIRTDAIESYEEIGGHGVKAIIGGREILTGSDRLLHCVDNIEHDTCHVPGTVVHVAVDRKYAGYITVADEIKEDSAAAVSALKKRGISKVVMLSGDKRQIAEEVGKKLGLDEVYSELLPHQKVEQLELLKKNVAAAKRGPGSKGRLLYVGDGINDAPVLAMADIGVAMGALGSDAAIEASDIVLMTDEPSKLVEAFDIAAKTRRIVWQNIVIALGVKLAVLVLGAGGIATMWEAVFADVGVTMIAVFNSLRLVKK